MASSKDSDKKQALSWKKPSLSKIDKPIAALSKASLFNSIKNALIALTDILRENKSDQKYRNIVDLIMFRLKIDLENININYSSISASEISEIVESALDALLAGAYKTSSFVPILDFSNAILVELQKRSSSKDKNVDSQLNSAVGELDEERLDQHTANSLTKERQLNARYSSALKTSLSTKLISSIYNDSILRILASIDQQFGKIIDLCLTTLKKPALSSKTAKNRKGIEVSKKLIALQLKLEKRQTHSMQYDGEDGEPSKMPSDILTNNIYKYNSKLFENLTPPGVALVLNIINAFQENAFAVGKSFLQLFPIIEQGICAASSTTEKIYNEINKSIFAKILDFIKGKAISHYILKPMRSKVIDLVLECLAKNKGRILSIVFAFMPFITGTLKDILYGFIEGTANIRDGTVSGIKTFGRILGKMLKTAFNAFVKIIKWTFKIGVAALKMVALGIKMAILAARALITIVRFAYKGVKFIVGLFKKTKLGKFLSKLGSKIKSAIDKVKGKVKLIALKVKNVFNKGKEFVKKMLSKAKNAIKDFGKRVANTVKNVVKKVAKKVFNVVKNTAKKVVQKIMKKLGLNIAKKIAKKKALSLLKMGAKKILGFFKNWVVKMIMKLAVKIAGAAALNVIPILGTIVSIGMMLWTLIDTIITFWDVYKFMKEYPEAWDFMKVKVAEWADKAFNFMKKLREWGEKLFRAIFIEGPKKFAKGVAHLLNFLSNPVASALKIAANAAYVKDLEAIKKLNFLKLDKMDPTKRSLFIKDKYKNNMDMLDKLRPKSEELTKQIQDEQESWWPNNKDILAWMEQRQVIHRSMMNYATEIGLSDFSQSTCNTAKQLVEEAEKKEAERIRIAKELAEHRKEMTLKYANKMIDLEALKTICKEYQDKFNEFNDDIQSFSKLIMAKSNKFIEQLEDITGDDYSKSGDEEEESLELAIV